ATRFRRCAPRIRHWRAEARPVRGGRIACEDQSHHTDDRIASFGNNVAMSTPDRPFGWRKRIGLLSPTVIETAAYDFFRLAPDGVSMCATTSNIEHWSKENFAEHVIAPLVTAVKYLASRNVDYIIHTGMPVVTTRGKGFEEEIVKLITDTTGLPATT